LNRWARCWGVLGYYQSVVVPISDSPLPAQQRPNLEVVDFKVTGKLGWPNSFAGMADEVSHRLFLRAFPQDADSPVVMCKHRYGTSVLR
jgi:hypothetical protein